MPTPTAPLKGKLFVDPLSGDVGYVVSNQTGPVTLLHRQTINLVDGTINGLDKASVDISKK